MPEALLSYRARQDLDAIGSHMAKSSLTAADRFLEEFWDRAATHVRWPKMGIPRDDVLRGTRCFVVQSHLAFYRIEGATIRILRVVHGSRDIPAAFHEPN